MARNGSGTFSYTATSVAPAVSSTLIDSSDFNTTLTEIETALTQSVSKDGQTVITGAMDFDGKEIILDVDGDTSITADTDDQIDFRIGGADIMSINSTGILDANKNEIIQLTSTASAVNDITVANASTGNPPVISATGGDTNIGIDITPKGTGPLDLTLGAFNANKGADIASATTTDIGAATGNFVDLTGGVPITSFGTVKAGTRRTVQFDGSLTLTHNATSLILPDGQNIQTYAGYIATFLSLGSGNWKMEGDRSAKPSFSVHKNGTNQLNITGIQKITWSTEEFDTNNDFASSTFTPTVAGKYLLSATLYWQDLSAGDSLINYIYKNGVEECNNRLIVPATGSGHMVSIEKIVDANGITDYFDIYAQNGVRDTSDIQGAAVNTYWTGCKID